MLYTSRANGRLGRLWRQQRIKYGSGVLLIATRTSKTIACIIINPYRYNVESIFLTEIVLEARCRGLRSIKSVWVKWCNNIWLWSDITVGCLSEGIPAYLCWLHGKRQPPVTISVLVASQKAGQPSYWCWLHVRGAPPSVDQRPLSSRHVGCASYFDWI